MGHCEEFQFEESGDQMAKASRREKFGPKQTCSLDWKIAYFESDSQTSFSIFQQPYPVLFFSNALLHPALASQSTEQMGCNVIATSPHRIYTANVATVNYLARLQYEIDMF